MVSNPFLTIADDSASLVELKQGLVLYLERPPTLDVVRQVDEYHMQYCGSQVRSFRSTTPGWLSRLVVTGVELLKKLAPLEPPTYANLLESPLRIASSSAIGCLLPRRVLDFPTQIHPRKFRPLAPGALRPVAENRRVVSDRPLRFESSYEAFAEHGEIAIPVGQRLETDVSAHQDFRLEDA